MERFREVTYKCTNDKCGHTQTVRYFDNEENKPLPFTCCVKCRRGFGMELRDQAMARAGMWPIAETTVRA